jgi:hypothetical protein
MTATELLSPSVGDDDGDHDGGGEHEDAEADHGD